MPQHTFSLESFATPTGELLLVSDDEQRVRALDWLDGETRLHKLLGRYYGRGSYELRKVARASAARQALQAYFEGELQALAALPVAFSGTEFQHIVWNALLEIPVGQTWSYGALADRIGRPGASRAVGLANGSNPISIIVPCHRVIGANAALTGYGGGIERKRWLLAHEGVDLGAASTQLTLLEI